MNDHNLSRRVNRSPVNNKARRESENMDDLGFSSLKKIILESAGYTPELLGAQLGEALRVLNEGLAAEKTQYFSHAGVVQDQRTDADHNIRLKAAAELASIVTILGDMKQQPGGGMGGGTQITLNVPFLADLKVESNTLDVTPAGNSSSYPPIHKQDQAPGT